MGVSLKTEGIDIKIFPVINFSVFRKDDEKEIKSILANISAHPIDIISEEIKNESRRALDQYWLDLLRITEDYLDELYSEAIRLVEKRLARAGTF